MQPQRDANGNKVVSSSGKFMGWNTIHRLETGDAYMTRFWIGRLRLHIFHRGDEDPDPHDHPWDFWTFPFVPYVEEVTVPCGGAIDWNGQVVPDSEQYMTVTQVVRAWRWNFRPATHRHRVIGAFDRYVHDDGDASEIALPQTTPGKKIVTLIWRSREYRKWGFLKHRDGRWCWVHWKEYVLGNGKSAPCE